MRTAHVRLTCQGAEVDRPQLYALARTLARPVCRGYLPLGHADASLITSTLSAERDGSVEPAEVGPTIKSLRAVLAFWIEHEDERRQSTAWRIKHTIRPMVKAHWPVRILMATAHDLNGAERFPLEEEEVSETVRNEVAWEVRRATGGSQHVR